MKNDETLTLEGMTYVNPEVSQAESLAFIDTLREMQAQNNAQINQQTQALGSDVPVYQGGLAGSEGIFQARYQTPQMDATVANLQNVARQTALNTALANQETMWKNRYEQARRALQDAQHNYTTKPSSTTPDTTGGNDGLQVDTETPSLGDLTVEQAPVSTPESNLNKNALEQAVYQATSSGNADTAGSSGIMYSQNGVNYYVVLYRNKLGTITGGSVYTASGGKLSPVLDYNQKGISGLLNEVARGGNKIYDLYGSDITNSWGLV